MDTNVKHAYNKKKKHRTPGRVNEYKIRSVKCWKMYENYFFLSMGTVSNIGPIILAAAVTRNADSRTANLAR